MLKLITCTLFVLRMHFACAQVLEDAIGGPSIVRGSSRPRPSDPVATFLSGLGNLFLDIDETFSKQLAPKVHAEDTVKEQMYGTPRSGESYFKRIRENYRDVQRRLGESLGVLDLRMSSNMGSVNVQNQGPKSNVDVSLPFLPMKLAMRSNRGLDTSDNGNYVTETTNIEPEQTPHRFTSSFKLGNTEIKMNSNLGPLQPSELLKSVENQIQKALQDARLTEGKIGDVTTEEKELNNKPELKNGLNSDTQEFSSRSGSNLASFEPSQMDYSNIEGRILGDVLYSESAFDKLTKRVMKDAKWVIDPKVFPSRVVEKMKQFSNKATDDISEANIASDKATTKTEEATISKIPQQQNRGAVKEDFKKRESLKPLNNNLETVLVDEKMDFLPQPGMNSKLEFQRLKDSVVLAFTAEGVPLKLRMGPEIVNPLKFLDKALRTYRVSLNIPVVSYDDIEPVGREILQLGTGSGGTMTRALYIDLSDSFQLESLLRTLRRTKLLQEM